MAQIKDLQAELNRQFELYAAQVEADTDAIAKKIAVESVETLKKTSPERTGDYAKGWDVKKQDKAYVVFNRTSYQLTHLLEKSHALRNGGRSRPKKHIKPVEKKAIEEFEKELRKGLST